MTLPGTSRNGSALTKWIQWLTRKKEVWESFFFLFNGCKILKYILFFLTKINNRGRLCIQFTASNSSLLQRILLIFLDNWHQLPVAHSHIANGSLESFMDHSHFVCIHFNGHIRADPPLFGLHWQFERESKFFLSIFFRMKWIWIIKKYIFIYKRFPNWLDFGF